MYHPSEWIADQEEGLSLEEKGPVLSTLRSARMTIPEKGKSIRDDWRVSSEEELLEDYWVGRCVFYEDWAEASREQAGGLQLVASSPPVAHVMNLMQGMKAAVETDKKAEMPNGLIFQDLYEYSLIDDLTGKPLDPSLVTIAKHEEIMEMYRRTVWVERPTTDCIRDTGKSPIPVRWVSTNKGDELHPNVRCRLVAKRLVAKYGGKEAEDLFAAMPPFELVKALLVKAVQRKDRKKKLRKLMFVDVSKAHLYAPVGPDVKAYVDLPPECSKPGVCGLLQYWLYGMRPASHGWQEEYVKQLGALGFKCGGRLPPAASIGRCVVRRARGRLHV